MIKRIMQAPFYIFGAILLILAGIFLWFGGVIDFEDI